MAAILHQLDQRRLIDANGIADGASIYFELTGTLTPTPVYTTAALTTEHPQPIVVASGAAVPDIYLDSEVTYRRRIVYPDGTVDDTDPYTAGAVRGSDLASTDPTLGAALVYQATRSAADRTVLAAIDGTKVPAVLLNEGVPAVRGRMGTFIWTSGDHSAAVTADTAQGVYVAPASDTTGASGAWVRHNATEMRVEWFGTGATALQAAIDLAKAIDRTSVVIPQGFEFASTVNLTSQQVLIRGEPSAQQDGSSDKKTSYLTWTGGASPMFSNDVGHSYFRDLTVKNVGNGVDVATCFLSMTAGALDFDFENMSFIPVDGSAAFSDSIVKGTGNVLAYSRCENVVFKAAAPKFVALDGIGTAQGVTSLTFVDCLFQPGPSATRILDLIDEAIERVVFQHCTFNITPGSGHNEMAVVDTMTAALDPAIRILVVEDCEFDIGSGATETWRFFKLKNVHTFHFVRNVVSGGGIVTSLIELTNSRMYIDGCDIRSINGPLIDCLDTLSTVDVGPNNYLQASTTDGIVKERTSGVTSVTYGPTMTVGLTKGNARKEMIYIDVTDAAAHTIITGAGGASQYPPPGAEFRYYIRNTTAGAIAATGFHALHKLRHGAFTAPAAGMNRWIDFMWDGTSFIETTRATADCAN